MATAKQKPNKFTLRGKVEGYVTMLKPDTKYKPEGEYKLQVLVNKNARGVAEALAEIDRVTEEANAAFMAANEKLPITKRFRGELPYQLPYTDLEDGRLLFKLKSIASGINLKGERWERVIPHFGGNGRIDPKQVPGYSEGTDLAVSFTINGFANKVAGQGASMRLEQVKLYEVVLFSSGNRSDFGDEDEGGYTPNADPEDDFDEANAVAGKPEAADDDEDF